MKHYLHRWVAATLSKLDVVKWDRFTESEKNLQVYGWIAREDGRSDFVLLTFTFRGRLLNYTTSSAKYSKEIGRILFDDDSDHLPCERVEDYFPSVENVCKEMK